MYENESYNSNSSGSYNNNGSYNNDNSQYSSYQTGGYYSGSAYGTAQTANGGDGKKKKGTFKKVLLSAGLGLLFGAFAGFGFYGMKLGSEFLVQTNTPDVQLSQDVINPAVMPNATGTTVNQITYVQDDVSDVVEQVMPAMVSIMNNYTVTSTTLWGQSYTTPASASGSGIIVKETENELLIVSNNHVVEGADTLEVTFIDGSTAQASIKGLDSDMDLGVIAVPLESLSAETKAAITVAALGDSDNLKLGTPVIAIGNALGFGQSVTTGIVSALDREITYDDGTTGTFIQTDAAINQGNSGGALLNINGEVIGINSSKIGGSMVEGMGYAIPISSASPIVAELMERETRVKVSEEEMGYMGITMLSVSEQVTQMYGMPQGVFVDDVEEGSPAAQAGVKRGDIIVKFDRSKVSSYTDIQENMQYYKAGESVNITVKRASSGEYENIDITITLGKRPESAK